jgi:hypothetical protein
MEGLEKNILFFILDYKIYSYLCTPVWKEREKEMWLRPYNTLEC